MPTKQPTTCNAKTRTTIAVLYLHGAAPVEIAAALKLPVAAVSNELRSLRQEWVSVMPTDFNEAKATELAKIDALEREYWDAWRSSLGEVTRSSRSNGTINQGKPTGKSNRNQKLSTHNSKLKTANSTQKTTNSKLTTGNSKAGDPRFLAGVQWCIKQRCVIFGVATQQEPYQNGFNGSFDPTKCTLEQLERIIKGEDPAGVLEKS